MAFLFQCGTDKRPDYTDVPKTDDAGLAVSRQWAGRTMNQAVEQNTVVTNVFSPGHD